MRSCADLESLRRCAGAGPGGRATLLKVYLRDAAAGDFVSAYLRDRLGAQAQFLVLAADICRRELLVEIDAADFGGHPERAK